ncbi:GTP cyclohydrolase II [Antribacter sp. KLBMP9083]|uniref:GTP cyclohydrolase-2 n=1 Tax=Antribacter soli TaxID=2910976 RepID=A0AA41QC90_9MICO|nr:GTP cyclohydrolase II [Antribacter soli]MCF4120769.1 GTP cyclohydrolase II [Antribacter soli]
MLAGGAAVVNGGFEARLATVPEALLELAAGRPVLVADDAGREDEVDVILAASAATAEWVAWTVRHTSGYLCAPLPAARADALGLPLMVARSEDPRGTAYTVSVDAAVGVTTGISASDRARTLRVLADPASGPEDLIRPGHVLPLRAVPGGVLERPGHTEAAVDLVRLAGLGEVGAIAELVHDDGEMVRLPAARALAAREGLVVLTVAELVAWRREHDNAVGGAGQGGEPALEGMGDEGPVARVQRVAEAALPTAYGDFRAIAYRDLRTGAEHLALVPQGPASDLWADRTSTMVRVHSECLTGDAFGSLRCDCGPQLQASLAAVAQDGGAVVYLRGHEGRGIGLAAKIAAYTLQDAGLDTVEANVELGLPVDAREYGAAAAILADLGIDRVTLLTNNPAKVSGLREAATDVVGAVPLQVGYGVHNHRYLETKRTVLGHSLSLEKWPGEGTKNDGIYEEARA